MTQMNLSVKQKETDKHKEHTWGEQMQIVTHRMDGQHGPTAQHRSLQTVSWEKPQQKRHNIYINIKKNYVCVCVYVCVYI